MKTINLCKEIRNVHNQIIIHGGKPLLMNQIIAACIGALKSKDSIEVIKNYDFALKVINFKVETKLEDWEYDKIKEALQKDMAHTDFVLGQIYKVLDETK